MNIDFKGKNVVVAGGSRGIGRSIALAFAASGANVSICARGAEALGATQLELRASGGKVLADPALRERFASQGLEIVGGTPQQFGEFIRRDTDRWREAVSASGAKLD